MQSSITAINHLTWLYYVFWLWWLTTCSSWCILSASKEAVRQLWLSRAKACWNWFWVHSSTNMIRVAAHKLGSISSSPQSATVLTILTEPTDLPRLLHSLQLFHWLCNWHLFTRLLMHSILAAPQPTHPRVPHNVHNEIITWTSQPLFERGKPVVCTGFYHAHISWQRMWSATGRMRAAKMKSCVGFSRFSLWGRDMSKLWGVRDTIVKQRVQFLRGSSSGSSICVDVHL